MGSNKCARADLAADSAEHSAMSVPSRERYKESRRRRRGQTADGVLWHDSKTIWGGCGNNYYLFMGIFDANRMDSGMAICGFKQFFSYESIR